MSEEHDSWLGGLGVSVENFVGNVVDSAESTVSNAVNTVESAASTVTQTVSSVAQAVEDAAPAALEAAKGVGSTYIDFQKGMAEGVYEGVKGLADIAEMATPVGMAKQAYKAYQFATDDKYREETINKVEGVAKFIGGAVVDPVGTGERIGKQVKAGYDKAAAEGHGAEFIGKGVGQVGVIVATSLVGAGEAEAAGLLAEGAEAVTAAGEAGVVMADAGVVAAEGAGEAGVLAADAGAIAEEGAIVAEEGAAVAEEGAAVAEEGGAAAAEEGGEAATVDAAAPKAQVPRSPTDPRATRPLGNIAQHNQQGLALRDASGARLSESEHVLSRANIVEQTRNPATGVSRFNDAAYRNATTLKLGRQTALEKTLGDNAAARALAESGGAPTAQMLEESSLEAAIDRTVAAAQATGDASVTSEAVNLAAHGELGSVFEVGTEDAAEVVSQASEEEIDALINGMEDATVDGSFAAPKFNGAAPKVRIADSVVEAAEGGAPSTRVRVAVEETSALEEAQAEAEAEAEAEAQEEAAAKSKKAKARATRKSTKR